MSTTPHVRYDILINVDRYKHATGYNPERAKLVLTYSGEIGRGQIAATLDDIFYRHNRDDRPDGKLGPSLSHGDVVHLVGEGYFAIGSERTTGWRPFDEIVAPDDVINDRTWSEVFDEARS